MTVFVQDYMYPDGSKVREYTTGTIKRYNVDGTVEEITEHEAATSTGLVDSPVIN